MRRYSSNRRRNSAVPPERMAILNRDGASSGKTSVKLKSAASGNIRRVARSAPYSTIVEAAAIPIRRMPATGQLCALGSSFDRTSAATMEQANGAA